MLYQLAQPKAPAEFVGKARRLADMLVNQAGRLDSDALLLTGPSGTGKTALAEFYARQWCRDPAMVFRVNGTKLNKECLDEMEQQTHYRYDEGICYLVDEAHNIRAQTREYMLSVAEHLGRRMLVVLTSTNDGQLFDDGEASSAFTSRFRIMRTAKPLDAEILDAVRRAAGLGGYEYVEEIARRSTAAAKGNVRAALSEYETLVMA